MNNLPLTPKTTDSKLEDTVYRSSTDNTLEREDLLQILRVALSVKEYRFARQTALHWLTYYPGDMKISLYYAKALIGENHIDQALPILKGICLADPEFSEAVECWFHSERQYQDNNIEPNRNSTAQKRIPRDTTDTKISLADWHLALSDKPDIPQEKRGAESQLWGYTLRSIRKSLTQGRVEQAESEIPVLLSVNQGSPLIALTHLRVMDANPNTPLAAKRSLAEFYRRNWPDCLPIMLMLSRWLMEGGSADKAVALLHQTVARDTSGQTPERLWGRDHPYRSLWPARLKIHFDQPIPASIASGLGWNQLPDRIILASSEEQLEEQPPDITATGDLGQIPDDETIGKEHPGLSCLFAATVISNQDENPPNPEQESISSTNETGLPEDRAKSKAEIAAIKKTIDQMAADLGQPELSSNDGRFPVYVIFSTQAGLEKQYGKEQTGQIVNAMKRLAANIQLNAVDHIQMKNIKTRWDAFVYLPDRIESTNQFGLKPVSSIDPWSLKLAIADLANALSKRGEVIGALLIVGGPEIVPFHLLPNPIDDPDQEVASDNPYGTRDENYFIPEWPIGRLPGGNNQDSSTLLKLINSIAHRYHKKDSRSKAISFWNRMTQWLQPSQTSSVGFTAAIWKQASISVYRPIGEERSMMVSPPLGTNGFSPNGSSPKNHRGLFSGRLGYFNLHGLEDAPEWYGQRDPFDQFEGPDYPVAIKPDDLIDSKSSLPLVVFSEACYGAHITGKEINQALSLQFLASDILAVVGSTTMSYGSVMAPLIAADLLGYYFWKGLKDGLVAGEALRKAKIQLASDMHTRQGYLDGEDQKTLISFVLYGDPLAMPIIDRRRIRVVKSKNGHNPDSSSGEDIPETFPTVCDRIIGQSDPISEEVMQTVKRLVANYLPGMARENFTDTEITYATERPICLAHDHNCPTHQLGRKNKDEISELENDGQNHPQNGDQKRRHLVKISKSYTTKSHSHQQIARLTLDQHGKLVKFVVSR